MIRALTSNLARRHPVPGGRVGPLISLAVLGSSSAVGATVLALPGLVGPSPSKPALSWLVLPGSWLLLASWALLYALLLRRLHGITLERAIYLAALCHTPLLLGLTLAAAVGGDAAAAREYATGYYGRRLFQTMAADFVVLAPALAQGALLALYGRAALVRSLPMVGIVLVALLLRLSRLGWGLPGLLHPDEHRYLGPAVVMAARGDLNPHYFENPSLMIYTHLLVFQLLTPQSIAFHTLNQLANLGIQDPRGDFLLMLAVRGVSGIAGVATVVAAYLTGRELFGRRAGLYAACLLAVSFLHVRNSHYSTNDVLATALLAFSLLFSVRIYSRGAVSDYLLAGVFGGLAASTKYSAGLFPLAMAAAHLARTLRSGGRGFPSTLDLLLPAAGVVSLLAFLAGTPYALLDHPHFLAGFRSQFGYGAAPWQGQEAQPSAVLFLSTLVQGFGLVPLALALLGVALASGRSRWPLAILLSVPAAYLLFMSGQRLFFARFAIPLLPFVSILAGYAINEIAGRWRGSPWGRRLALLVLAAALVQPVAFSLKHDAITGQADTRFQAAAWIDANVPPGVPLAVESYASLDAKFGWKGHSAIDSWMYWPENEQSLARAFGGAYRYVVVSSFGYGVRQSPGDEPSTLRGPYSDLEGRGRLVALFAPGRDNGEIAYFVDDMYTPFWNLAERVRPGPTIRIYEIDPH